MNRHRACTAACVVLAVSACGGATAIASDRDALACPPGAGQEGEPCGESVNGGCGEIPPAYEPIACGETICGTAWADASMRDTDWYEVVTTDAGVLEWTVVAEFPVQIGLVETTTPGSGDCWEMNGLNPFASGAAGETVSITTPNLPPGTYWFHVSNQQFDGYPCGTDNDYVAMLTSVGSCPADLTGDDTVGVEDFLFLLAAWGTPAGDVNDDGTTDVADFLDLLAAWGPCP
jgi:hypothetical protein